MTLSKNWFLGQLDKASDAVIKFTREMVIQDLPIKRKYVVFPNQSYDRNIEDSAIDVYPDDKEGLFDGHAEILDTQNVVDWCVRKSKVPEWINISVESSNHEFTLLKLECCGRFNGIEKDLYYFRQGTHPFGIKSPSLPKGYVEGTKFDLYWKNRIRI